jgi:hypothetical protein
MGSLKKYVFGRVKGVILDADAQAFITAASITNTTQKNAINTLVLDLKSFGIWSKMKAIYPMVGGNLFSHKFNLKDPRDLDVAFRLLFVGNVLHDSNGIKGTNAYANTFLTPSVSLNNNNTHLSIYSRTNIAGTYVDFGCNSTTDFSPRFAMHLKWIDNKGYFDMNNASNARITISPMPDSLGLITLSRTSNSTMSLFKRGTAIGVNTLLNTESLPNKPIYIMASNSFSTDYNFSPRVYSFSSVGSGLTSAEVASLNNLVQEFQTSLGRQV